MFKQLYNIYLSLSTVDNNAQDKHYFLLLWIVECVSASKYKI